MSYKAKAVSYKAKAVPYKAKAVSYKAKAVSYKAKAVSYKAQAVSYRSRSGEGRIFRSPRSKTAAIDTSTAGIMWSAWPRAGWVSTLLLEWLRNAVQPPGSTDVPRSGQSLPGPSRNSRSSRRLPVPRRPTPWL